MNIRPTPAVEQAREDRLREGLLDAAIDLLAGWCDAVTNRGTGWDDWDEWYKDACYRPGPLRELIDARMAKITDDRSMPNAGAMTPATESDHGK